MIEYKSKVRVARYGAIYIYVNSLIFSCIANAVNLVFLRHLTDKNGQLRGVPYPSHFPRIATRHAFDLLAEIFWTIAALPSVEISLYVMV